MSCRAYEPGWMRIGRIDSTGRRSLWIRETDGTIELCAGREGDDAYVKITPENPQWIELEDVLRSARFAAEFEDADGLTLERESPSGGVTMIKARHNSIRAFEDQAASPGHRISVLQWDEFDTVLIAHEVTLPERVHLTTANRKEVLDELQLTIDEIRWLRDRFNEILGDTK